MTKKASELKRGDITPMGGVAHKFYHGDGLAILCEGGQWFDCDSGDDLVKVHARTIKARDLKNGQIIYLQGRARPTRIAQIAGCDDGDGFLVSGFMHEKGADPYTAPKDWIRVRGDHEFEVVE